MVSIENPEYQFHIYHENNQKYLYARSDVITEGGPWSMSTPDRKIMKDYIKQHYEPRPLFNLEGVEKYFEPLFDSREIYKKAFALMDRLIEEMEGQKELQL